MNWRRQVISIGLMLLLAPPLISSTAPGGKPVWGEGRDQALKLQPAAIDTIVIEGAYVTKPGIILREMTIQPGSRVTEEDLHENADRIQNLGLFSRVQLTIRRQDERNALVVSVTEQWYIFPLPFWQKEGGDFSKISYGFEYLQKNFRGRNERISIRLWTGFEKGYQLAYSNPWIAGKGIWGSSLALFRTTRDVRNEKYRALGTEIKTTGGHVAIQRRFGLDTRLTASIAFTRYSSLYSQLMVSRTTKDDWVSVGLALLLDERDLYEYPSEGWYRMINLGSQMLVNGPGQLSDGTAVTASYEARRYFPIFLDFILCGKTLVGISAGRVPLYRRYFLGSNEETQIRGWRGQIQEGEGVFLGSMELRRRIFDIRYLTWSGAPVAKRYFRNLKYGLSGGLFLDLGQTWIRPSEASSRRFQAGWGVGLHLHLPYLDVLRLEAGWSPDASFKDAAISIRSRVAF